MNYEKNYEDYVRWAQAQNRAKYRGTYYEEHHVKPRSLGGKDVKSNLVLLTPREHFLAHYLLCKVYPTGEEHYKMVCAFNLFLTRDESAIVSFNGRSFERKKLGWIESLKTASRERIRADRSPKAVKAKAKKPKKTVTKKAGAKRKPAKSKATEAKGTRKPRSPRKERP